MNKIVMTGGGTGGHVTPNLALIPRLMEDGFEIHYIGEENGVEQGLVSAVPGVSYYGISAGKLRRYFDLKNLTDPARVIKGFFQARRVLKSIRPDMVFSKGGFVSVPVVYAAWTLGIPVVAHESDITPGLANKLSTPLAKTVCCTFQHAADLIGKKGVYTGTPIRPEILAGDREAGLKRFQFHKNMPVLMVTGGSSGAQAVNTLVRDSLSELLESFQVLHLCGKGNIDDECIGMTGYVQCEYLTDSMPDAYACADVILSRAGANTLSELVALHKPTLLIPSPKGASRGDQVLNAEDFEKRGLARVLPQETATGEKLVSELFKLYRDRDQYAERMKKEPASNGLENVLKEIYKVVRP